MWYLIEDTGCILLCICTERGRASVNVKRKGKYDDGLIAKLGKVLKVFVVESLK